MQAYNSDQIAYAVVMARRHERAMNAAILAWEANGSTLAGKRAAVAGVLAAFQDYAAWLAQDTRPGTAPGWELVGSDIDGHSVGPLDDFTADLPPTVY